MELGQKEIVVKSRRVRKVIRVKKKKKKHKSGRKKDIKFGSKTSLKRIVCCE